MLSLARASMLFPCALLACCSNANAFPVTCTASPVAAMMLGSQSLDLETWRQETGDQE